MLIIIEIVIETEIILMIETLEAIIVLQNIIMMSIMIPAAGTAAVPIEARTVVRIMVIWSPIVRSIPKACDINTAATAWYCAVPSIFIVAPSGRTKEEISSETPNSSSQRSIVIGSVAPLELVEKASN